ncbi:MAG TPA: DCC1-like thiol-disulfide oxidoreductase family protein [Thermoleophilaceae bacterium]|nr:DCC1-like thiol-disulfide oxidoreductase family protein [Thermoleophilaceae bacterium]
MEPLPVLYDRDCGVCRTILGTLLAWDRDHRLRPVEIQSPEGESLLAGMSEEERLDSWHMAGPAGVRSAGAAFPDLFQLLPGGAPLAELSRRAPGPSERAYRLVAGNRSKLSKLVPAGVRDRADRLIARRR